MPYERSKRYSHLFKKNGSSRWWCYLPNPAGGRRLERSTECSDEKAAHARYLLLIQSDNGRTLQAEGKQRTLRDALGSRIAWLKAARASNDETRKKLSADTITFYEKKAKPLLAFFGADSLLSSIDHEQIRKYIIWRSTSAKATTIAREFTTLSMAMRLARKDGVECAEFKDLKPDDFEAVYVPRGRWCSEEEVDALLPLLLPKHAAVVAFIVACGATFPSEVYRVREEQVNAKAYDVHIPGTKRKLRDRVVRVPAYARKYLDFALRHAERPTDGPRAGFLFGRWTSANRDLIRACETLSLCVGCREERRAWAHHEKGALKPISSCKKCDAIREAGGVVEPLAPVDLRRTFAQWLVRSGVPYELAGPMMGHDGDKMLRQVYGKRDGAALADLVALALKTAPKNARKK